MIPSVIPLSSAIGGELNSSTPRHSMMDFLACEEQIQIIPAFDCNILSFISGDYGPFVATMPISVPLWLALELRRTHRCRITPPEWLCQAFLSQVLEWEKNPSNEGFFESAPSPLDQAREIELPFYYQQISDVLLKVCPSDFPSPKSLVPLLSDISCLRSSKSRNILKTLTYSIQNEGSPTTSPPEVSYNMRSGWKASEVQQFKGITFEILNNSFII